MKIVFIAIIFAVFFSGCAAKNVKELGGGIMSASNSAGFAGIITFPIGGLMYLGGAAAEEDAEAK